MTEQVIEVAHGVEVEAPATGLARRRWTGLCLLAG